MPTTVKARSMPLNYDKELYSTVVRLCMSKKLLDAYIELIKWYHNVYASYIMFLWDSIAIVATDTKYMRPIGYFNKYLRRSRNKPKFVARTVIDRILYFVWKTFIVYDKEIYMTKYYNSKDKDFSVINYIETLMAKHETDVPVFTTKTDMIVMNKYVIGLEKMYDGFFKLPKSGLISIYQKDMKNLPNLDDYIQAIALLNPEKHNKKCDHFGYSNDTAYFVPCMIYYNKPKTIFNMKKMLKHLEYYDRLGLIDIITGTPAKNNSNDLQFYCNIKYFKTLKDKKNRIYTETRINDVIPMPNAHDLNIIRKYLDEIFTGRETHVYDIVVSETGNITIKLFKINDEHRHGKNIIFNQKGGKLS